MIDADALIRTLFRLAEARLGLRPELRQVTRFQRETLIDIGDPQDRVWLLRPETGRRAVVETLILPPGARRPVILRRDPAPCALGFARVPLRKTGIRPPTPPAPVRLELGGSAQVLELPLDAAAELVQSMALSERERGHVHDLIGLELRRLADAEASAAYATTAEPALRLIDLVQAERDLAGKAVARDLMPARELRERVQPFIDAGDVTRHFQEFARAGLLEETRARLPRLTDDVEATPETTIRDAWRIAAPQRIEALAEIVRDRSVPRLRALTAQVRDLVANGALSGARNLGLDLALYFPWDLELRYRAVLAMARLGAGPEALATLDALVGPEGQGETTAEPLETLLAALVGEGLDEKAMPDWLRTLLPPPGFELTRAAATNLVRDVFALRGRLHKDRLVQALQQGADGTEHARRSHRAYAQVSDWRPGDHYVAINAAAMAAVSGQSEAAEAYARRAVASALQGQDYWSLATLAEGQALLGQTEAARESLALAVQAAAEAEAFADIASMRRQYRLLAPFAGSAAELARALPDEPVAVVTGHMMPLEGVTTADRDGYAAELGERVLKAGGAQDRAGNTPELPRHLFCALARGADIIAARAWTGTGEAGLLHVVLPFDPDTFRALSVVGPGQAEHLRHWSAAYDALLDEAASVHIVTRTEIAEADRWSAIVVGNWVMTGLALLKADEVMSAQRSCLAVVADETMSSLEGAFALAGEWERFGLPVTRLPCAWRTPYKGPAPEPRALPWSLVVQVHGCDDWKSLVFFLKRCGFQDDSVEQIFGLKNWLAFRTKLTDRALQSICQAACTYRLRMVADFVPVTQRAGKFDFGIDLGDAGALRQGCLHLAANLAAILRFRHHAVGAVVPSGLLKRDRKETGGARPVAPSIPLWRLLLREGAGA